MTSPPSNQPGNAPQKLDSVVRTITTALLALILVGAVVIIAVHSQPHDQLSPLQAVLVGWAGVIVGFYFGGHIAQNTATLEEARLKRAADSSEASAVRSEAAAPAVPEQTLEPTDKPKGDTP